MNVMLVVYDFSLSGGSEKVMLKLYNEFSKKINVKMVSLYHEKQAGLCDDKVEYLYNRKGTLKTDIIPTISRLIHSSKTFNSDIIVSVGVNASFFVCIAGRFLKTKCIVCEHSNISNVLYNNWLQIFRRAIAVRLCDKFVSLTYTDMMDYSHKYTKYAHKFKYIYNWAEVNCTEEIKYDEESKKIITMCRIDRVKGLEYSIDVFEKLYLDYPDWSWEIYGIGDDSYFEELNYKLSSLHIERFFFKGYSKDINEIYKHSAIYCCNSLYEGMPLSLLEAKCWKIPIVSFDCKTGPNEIIENNVNGFLVPSGDVECFSVKLRELMNDVELRKKFSDNSYSNIAKFDKQFIVELWFSLFDSLL